MPRVIVSFQNEITDSEMDKAINDIKANGGTIKDDYRPLLKAVAADIPESYSGRLTDDKLVKNIELDSVVTTQDM
ncbi:hypothetical protein AGABI2DRAFT_192618 [Agaricus bisporus var. bisporus H97]|uniref:hypothetical protein n=1 Tax=Agaricus bisporus var. bisporus (strain H97 / ATCC MYA-4626 / FGSC 10389) TaxID=936046 RepID=UPI00029F7DC6|nr:hypothetical protein AGABI2DRAFT_192618 [Agaricus bisporus var. bisporus H97]EKV47427.1 hypothetical protein AGABI2DRAFT_192618 [Agaricus bisporus var. bisporus H97]